jgi:gluconolactonase
MKLGIRHWVFGVGEKPRRRAGIVAAVLVGVVAGLARTSALAQPAPAGTPLAVVDLATSEGARLVKGQWRYSDTRIIEVTHHAPDSEGQPTGKEIRTYDYTPHAGVAGFDDSRWEVIEPETLAQRRSTGRLCFNWYRINMTIPERVGSFDPAGAAAVFETTVDDYAEVWVNGELARGIGQSGGSVVAGWNTPNRILLGRSVKPGQKFQIAVFGANGPLSDPPANFIWLRSAKLEFFPGAGTEPVVEAPREVNVRIERKDPALDEIVPANPKLYKLAEGFQFTEGPIWLRKENALLFSDPNANRIYRWSSDGGLSVFRERSGYDGADIGSYTQPGSNGLTLDSEGRLTIDQHGRRRVVRLEANGKETVLADRYEGKRLNSPNDLVYRSDGTLYFTDPPFGLPKFFDDPRKELPYSGVYAVKDGKTRLLTKDLAGPNGLAFSPDEKYLYVDNWDTSRKLVMRYPVQPDGGLGSGEVFYDMTGAPGEEALDGLKVDVRGNVYVSGPGGLWILSPEGKHLGTIVAPQLPANFTWGDADGKTLYLCARAGLYRMPLKVQGSPAR